MTLTFLAGAILAVASFVMGLAGFGIALVALAFLPYVMSPVDAIVLTTLYALVFSAGMLWPLRPELEPARLGHLLAGTLAGTPAGVWALATLPTTAINRLIGVSLILVVALEWRRPAPHRWRTPGWGILAGLLAGAMGGAIGTPGPPVVLYASAQGWSPRAMKANMLAFFTVNQGVILAGYWWAGLVTARVLELSVVFALPATLGVVAGIAAFDRIDARRFRMVVFGTLLASGVTLLVRG